MSWIANDEASSETKYRQVLVLAANIRSLKYKVGRLHHKCTVVCVVFILFPMGLAEKR